MNNNTPENRIRHALDARLTGVTEKPGSLNKVLRQAKGEVKVKKKISASLVIALILALLSITALAVALLTPKEIIENYGVPIANQSEGSAYSIEETNLLLQLALDNGVQLSDQAIEDIKRFTDNGEGYYKDEFLKELTKAEFGQDPSDWTLEQQLWFSQVWEAIGIGESASRLPAEGEITQAEAEQIAIDYIHATYDASLDLRDTATFKPSVTYLDGRVDGEYDGLYWTIGFYAQVMTASDYTVYMNSQGEVFEAIMRPGVQPGVQVDWIQIGFKDYYGRDFATWDQAVLQAFREAMALAGPPHTPDYLSIMETTYPDIAENAMTAEEAGKTAAKAAGMGEDTYQGAVYIGDDPNPVWKVHLHDTTQNITRYVEVDSVTGEVKSIFTCAQHYDEWYRPLVLQKIFEEVNEAWDPQSISVG